MTREELVQAIKINCLRYGDFTLKSGQHSLFYMDLRTVTISSLLAALVNEINNDLKGVAFDAIGGPSTGADPLVSGYLYAFSNRQYMPLRGFFVRKEEKGHGMKDLVIGSVKYGDKVVVVEDVTTTAGSLVKAIKAIQHYGCLVVRALTVIDRSLIEHGQSQAKKWIEQQENIPFSSLFTLADFGMDTDQKLTLEYLRQAIELASQVSLTGEPWSWTRPESMAAIMDVLEGHQALALQDRLHIWSKDNTVYKIEIRPEVYKKE